MIIERLNGQQIDIENYGVHRLFHFIPSLGVEHSTSNVDGRSSKVYHDTKYVRDNIKVRLLYLTRDIYDFYLLRDEMSNLFASKEPFYIIFKKEPYKRWRVRLANKFDMEPNPKGAPFEIDFICDNIFAESVGTSLDMINRDFDSGKWGFGSGIDVEEVNNYIHTTQNFNIDNIGTHEIVPTESELEITFVGVVSSTLTIKNDTTGDVYQHRGSLTNSDTLVLKGIQTFKNGISSFKNTNYKNISLAVGNNNFTITGATSQRITFKFRFLYK